MLSTLQSELQIMVRFLLCQPFCGKLFFFHNMLNDLFDCWQTHLYCAILKSVVFYEPFSESSRLLIMNIKSFINHKQQSQRTPQKQLCWSNRFSIAQMNGFFCSQSHFFSRKLKRKNLFIKEYHFTFPNDRNRMIELVSVWDDRTKPSSVSWVLRLEKFGLKVFVEF